MKPYNWTDYEHPCFNDYNADPMSMTKDEFIEHAETIEECEDVYGDTNCYHLSHGGSWDTCSYGRLSKHCDWLPKEAKNAG